MLDIWGVDVTDKFSRHFVSLASVYLLYVVCLISGCQTIDLQLYRLNVCLYLAFKVCPEYEVYDMRITVSKNDAHN